MEQASPYQAPDSQVYNIDDSEYDKTRFFSLNQRIGRARFVAYSLIAYFVYFFALAGILIAFRFVFGLPSTESESSPLMSFVYVFSYLAVVSLVARRRLRDLGQSGWLSLLYLIPLINIIFWFYLALARGEPTANTYGLRPAPNTIGTWILAALVPITIIGVIAAVAIPAYQDYVDRAKAAQTRN